MLSLESPLLAQAEVLVLGPICFLPIFLISLAATAFWVWMLVDCLMKEPSEGNDKVIWALVIVFTHLLGALIYYFLRRPQRIQQYGE